MIPATMLDDCLKRLRVMSAGTVRRDYRLTAQLAARVISELSKAGADDERRLRFLAMTICDRAAKNPQIVYTTKRTGEVRTLAANAATAKRIRPESVIGCYDAGANWKDVLEDLAA
jgi:hypothetical protein